MSIEKLHWLYAVSRIHLLATARKAPGQFATKERHVKDLCYFWELQLTPRNSLHVPPFHKIQSAEVRYFRVCSADANAAIQEKQAKIYPVVCAAANTMKHLESNFALRGSTLNNCGSVLSHCPLACRQRRVGRIQGCTDSVDPLQILIDNSFAHSISTSNLLRHLFYTRSPLAAVVDCRA